MNNLVDKYLIDGCMRCSLGATPECKVLKWTEDLKYLRAIALSTGLEEEIKWGVPCYTLDGKNIFMISAFKDFCAVSFFKGALLSDSHNILQKPGPNSQASRLLKYTDPAQVIDQEEAIRSYMTEAISIEKKGLVIEFKKETEAMPPELIEKMNDDPTFRSAFESLTPGRQRGYILYFSGAKQSKTRMARIDKYTPMILNGEGMHDHYKSGK